MNSSTIHTCIHAYIHTYIHAYTPLIAMACHKAWDNPNRHVHTDVAARPKSMTGRMPIRSESHPHMNDERNWPSMKLEAILKCV